MDKKSKEAQEQMLIRRAFSVQDFKTEETGSRVVGHAAVFNRMTTIGDWFYEVIERGAFDSADLTDVLFFVNHDMSKIPMARSRNNNGNSTMKIGIDDIGLLVDATLDVDNNSEAKSLYGSIGRGDMDGMSFLFRVKEQVWENLDTEMPTRRITKISKVYEVSAVNFPAYVDTDISARDQAALDSARQALDSARELDSSKQSEIELLKLKNRMKGRY